MRVSKLCIRLALIIFLILSVSGCVQQEDKIQQEDQVKNESDPQPQSGLLSQKDSVALQVSEAAGLIEKDGEETFPEFREKGGKWFRGDSYIFIWNTNGTRVVYPPDPDVEGQDVSGITDINGKPIGKLFIETAIGESGEGWVSYEWPKPGETEPSTKYSFIKRAVSGEKTYLVGSGFYVEDYLFTKDIRNCEFINKTRISLCELIQPGRTDGEPGVNYSLTYAVLEPGEESLPQRLSNPEIHYVLEGSGTIYIDDVPVPLHEGKLVHVPAHEIQYIENTGNSSLSFLVIDS